MVCPTHENGYYWIAGAFWHQALGPINVTWCPRRSQSASSSNEDTCWMTHDIDHWWVESQSETRSNNSSFFPSVDCPFDFKNSCEKRRKEPVKNTYARPHDWDVPSIDQRVTRHRRNISIESIRCQKARTLARVPLACLLLISASSTLTSYSSMR